MSRFQIGLLILLALSQAGTIAALMVVAQRPDYISTVVRLDAESFKAIPFKVKIDGPLTIQTMTTLDVEMKQRLPIEIQGNVNVGIVGTVDTRTTSAIRVQPSGPLGAFDVRLSR